MCVEFCIMVHRGEILKQAILDSGFSISLVAKRLGKSRRFMYDLFENPQVPIDHLLQIGKIISYDFSSQISEIKNFTVASETFSETDWMKKYLTLLEKYNKLLEDGIEQYFLSDIKASKKN